MTSDLGRCVKMSSLVNHSQAAKYLACTAFAHAAGDGLKQYWCRYLTSASLELVL